MTDAPAPLPPEPFDRDAIGGNHPPEDSALDRVQQLIPACDGWTAKGALTTEDEARTLSEFLIQLRQARSAAEAERDAELKPHEDAIAIVQSRFKRPLAQVDLAIERIAGSRKVAGLLADWISRKNRQLAEEAAAKAQAAEEAKRAAERAVDRSAVTGTIDAELAAEQAVLEAAEAAKAARRAPIRGSVKGDLAKRAVSLTTYWEARIVDWPAARKHYRREERVSKAYDAAVQSCANDDARRLKDPKQAPAGVEFISREQAK
jgi:hypothetical protein